MKNTGRVHGSVHKLLPAKKSGFVILQDSEEEFYFLADRLRNAEYDNLKKGDHVTFTIGSESKVGHKFANAIDIVASDAKHEVKEPLPIKSESQSNQSITTELIKSLLAVFEKAEHCKSPDDFEDASFILLRCLGIHNLYQFDRKNQAGQADGFFSIGNLAVMYDCTLRNSFEEHKKEQIENYVNKLNNKSQLTIDIIRSDGGSGSKVLQISGKSRQVWIITRNKTRELNDYDGIKVKEVSFQDLIKVLATRLHSGIFEQEDLSAKLTLIDRT